MSKRIHIKQGRVIDPASNTDKITDLFIDHGKIVGIGSLGGTSRPYPDFTADLTIDATGLIVSPGFIDLSCRLREPGQTHKGDIKSETTAAAASGFTRICCPPDTTPPVDTAAIATMINEKAAAAGFCKVSLLGAMTKGLEGKQLSEMHALKEAGCIGVSNAWHSFADNQTLRKCLEYASTFDLIYFSNPLDKSLANNGCAHEGAIATRLGLPSIPALAEVVALSRDILLAEQVGIHIHFCQLSSAKAVKLVADAQRSGLPVTADVSAHQLMFTDECLDNYQSLYHLRPPLRSPEDLDGLKTGIKNNTITAICSDHQPHEPAAKMAPFPATEPGISALETLLPLALNLVSVGQLSLMALIEKLSLAPAKILGVDEGKICLNGSADLCIFNPDKQWTLEADSMLSKGKNSPLLNQTLTGQVQYTLVDGELSFSKNEPGS